MSTCEELAFTLKTLKKIFECSKFLRVDLKRKYNSLTTKFPTEM